MAYGTLQLDGIQSSTPKVPTIFRDYLGVEAGKLCRAWVQFNGVSGANPVILASYNVASVTRSSLGLYIITYKTPMPTEYYSAIAATQPWNYNGTWAGTGSTQAGNQTMTQGTVEVRITTSNANGDSNMISYAVFA